MLRHNLPTKLVAIALVLALPGFAGVASAASSPASLSGRVLAAGSAEPLTGWTVLVGNPRTRTVESSTTTGTDGSFRVSGLAPATYEIALQSGSTLYPVSSAVRLAPGQARDVQLAVNQKKAPPPGQTGQSDSGAASWWSNPVVATLAVIGGAVLVGVILDNTSNESQSASPSAP